MGLFSKKDKGPAVEPKAAKTVKTASKKPAALPAVSATVSVPTFVNKQVILRPRITEKSTEKADTENVFVFEIAQSATKHQVRKAIAALYNVSPVKVSIARNPSKAILYRGKIGRTAGVKKAYVYLKKGEKIEIV